MQKNTLNLEISSAEDLKKQLEELTQSKKAQPRLAELKIYGSEILVRQFDLAHINSKELIKALKLDAVEILSLPTQEIELDYKIIDSSADRTKGIYLAMPSVRFQEYLQCFAKSGIIPVKITARSVSVLGKFLAANPEVTKNNFCFLDFSKSNTVNLAVFINGHCELIREIVYENFDHAERSVLDSLNYSYGRSVGKQLNKFYFSGEVIDKEDLIKRLEKKIEIESKSAFTGDIFHPAKASYHEIFSKLNLLNEYSLILPVRNSILLIERILLVAGLVFCLILAVKSNKNSQSIKELRSSFNAKDYDYARKLQEKVRASNYAK